MTSRTTTGIAPKSWNGCPKSICPNSLQPQMGTDWSPVGQIYWYTLKSTNPQIRSDGTEIASRIGRSRSNSSPCPTSSTSPALAASRANIRFALIPNKLVSYGLSIGPGRTATRQQQRQCRRQFRRVRLAADQRPGIGSVHQRRKISSKLGYQDAKRHGAAR